ncbi:MAG: VWA domain-containing protein [Candidatus Korobacteraceae bacterium]
MKTNSANTVVTLLALALLGTTLAAQQTTAPVQAKSDDTTTTLASSPAVARQDSHEGPSEALASVPPGNANHRITLDVVVADRSGHALAGLQQQDFTLLDDKQPQKIVSFHAVAGASATADPPVEVILVVDEVNTSFRNVEIERQQIQKLLSQNGGELVRPVSIVFFSDAGATIRNTPSRDGKTLIADLNQNKNALRTSGRAQGFYGAVDRLNLSLRALGQLADYEAARPGRKLVVWISPGWPLFSGPNVELSSKDQQQLFNSIVAVSDELRRARITLYDVDPLGMEDEVGVRTSYYKDFVKGVSAARQVRVGNLALQVLAYQSGGLVLNSNNDVAGEIATCIADANAFYVLSFDGAVGDAPNEYHALEIKIDKPGLAARTRSGYYAQPERVRTP